MDCGISLCDVGAQRPMGTVEAVGTWWSEASTRPLASWVGSDWYVHHSGSRVTTGNPLGWRKRSKRGITENDVFGLHMPHDSNSLITAVAGAGQAPITTNLGTVAGPHKAMVGHSVPLVVAFFSGEDLRLHLV